MTIEKSNIKKQRARAIKKLLKFRAKQKPVTAAQIKSARKMGRP